MSCRPNAGQHYKSNHFTLIRQGDRLAAPFEIHRPRECAGGCGLSLISVAGRDKLPRLTTGLSPIAVPVASPRGRLMSGGQPTRQESISAAPQQKSGCRFLI